MSFIITDGADRCIRFDRMSKKYVAVRGLKYATAWPTFQKASSILHSSLSKPMRKGLMVRESDMEVNVAQAYQPQSTTVAEADIVPEENVIKVAKIPVMAQLSQSDAWLERMRYMLKIRQETNGRKAELIQMLSDVDKEITDLYHFIEGDSLDAYKGFLAYKHLRGRLIRRRDIKEELELIQIVDENVLAENRIESIISNLQNGRARNYVPRALNVLFEEGITSKQL